MAKIYVSQIIGIDKEAFLYLNRMSRVQRGCAPLTEQIEDRMWSKIPKQNGLKVVDDDSFGGGDGTYYGKWTKWNVETIKRLLKDGGYTWVELGTREYMDAF